MGEIYCGMRNITYGGINNQKEHPARPGTPLSAPVGLDALRAHTFKPKLLCGISGTLIGENKTHKSSRCLGLVVITESDKLASINCPPYPPLPPLSNVLVCLIVPLNRVRQVYTGIQPPSCKAIRLSPIPSRSASLRIHIILSRGPRPHRRAAEERGLQRW